MTISPTVSNVNKNTPTHPRNSDRNQLHVYKCLITISNDNHRWHNIWKALHLSPFAPIEMKQVSSLSDTNWRLYWTVQNFNFARLFILIKPLLVFLVLCSFIYLFFYSHSQEFVKYCLIDKNVEGDKNIFSIIFQTLLD